MRFQLTMALAVSWMLQAGAPASAATDVDTAAKDTGHATAKATKDFAYGTAETSDSMNIIPWAVDPGAAVTTAMLKALRSGPTTVSGPQEKPRGDERLQFPPKARKSDLQGAGANSVMNHH